jgi:uncharacterized damage-inducible protein DinB
MRECLDSLSEEQVWWRPNDSSNSIGNLLLHLNGNLRQWVIAGLGGEKDTRDRDSEFSAHGPIPVTDLREKLEATIIHVDAIFAKLTTTGLLEKRDIQRNKDVTGLEAVYHVTEHFAMHYGQVLYITKMLTDRDLGFYSYLSKKQD